MTLQNIVSRQGLDQVAIQINHKRINQLAGPLEYSVVDGYLIPNLSDLGDQQVSNNLTNPATAEAYAGNQQVGTGGPGNWEGAEPQLDNSAETLPQAPRTPNTSFEVSSGAGVAQTNSGPNILGTSFEVPQSAPSGTGTARINGWPKPNGRQQQELWSLE